MPEEKVKLDVTEIENFIYDMEGCIKCKGCTWVDHIYMPGVKFSRRCPSAQRYLFDSYGAYGRLRIGLALIEGRLDYSDSLLQVLYTCTLCGACDAGCKRNLDLEPLLALEALRIKCVRDGKGPLPEHRKIAENISTSHNRLGAPHGNRTKWLPEEVTPSSKAEVLYFVGCSSSYLHPEISQATVKILKASGTEFMLLGPEEWCCGNVLYSTGMVDEAKAVAEHNLEAIRKSGAAIVLTSCAECYRMLKVDYPKMFKTSTADLGFKVVHLVEYMDELIKGGKLELVNRIDLRLTYHDSCSLGRLSEPWVHWEGTRGKWGVLNPRLERRRGSNGIYGQPREMLRSIPGVELVEMPRMKENAWCCGAGRGARDAFRDFALWAARERLDEANEVGAEAIVSACPWCKDNFLEVIESKGDRIRAYDISELILQAISS